jgi:hypothetical protein
MNRSAALASLWHRLDNEPIVRWLGSIAGLTALVQLLAALDVVSADVATALTAFLVAAGVGAAKHVRSQVVGPVTASQMVRLPGTDPTKQVD